MVKTQWRCQILVSLKDMLIVFYSVFIATGRAETAFVAEKDKF